MPRIPGTTNRQSAFLRSFRLDPNPPRPSWPSRAILDRWLRRPAFRIAYDQIRESQRKARALFVFGSADQAIPRAPTPPSAKALCRIFHAIHVQYIGRAIQDLRLTSPPPRVCSFANDLLFL